MAKVKTIKAEYGASAEIQGVWHKFYFGIELELDEGDDTEAVKEKAWNTCHVEVEKQFNELVKK